MTSLDESWERTKAHLLRAARLAGDRQPKAFADYLAHNELQLAADVLAALGDERGDLPREFWEALTYAYDNMKLETSVARCRFRSQEAEHGYIEARLTLLEPRHGGRRSPIATDYRSSWSVGRTQDGAAQIHDAPVSLEDCLLLQPGQTGTVRLHPRWPDGWPRVAEGDPIDMHEGSRVVGRAIVVRVALRSASR